MPERNKPRSVSRRAADPTRGGVEDWEREVQQQAMTEAVIERLRDPFRNWEEFPSDNAWDQIPASDY